MLPFTHRNGMERFYLSTIHVAVYTTPADFLRSFTLFYPVAILTASTHPPLSPAPARAPLAVICLLWMIVSDFALSLVSLLPSIFLLHPTTLIYRTPNPPLLHTPEVPGYITSPNIPALIFIQSL